MPSLTADGRRLNGKRSSAWITALRRTAIYLRHRFRCVYCHTDLAGADPRRLTLDHLRPVVAGGGHKSSNLVLACLSCNSRRQHMPLHKFVPNAEHRRRIYQSARRKLNVPLAREIRARTITITELEEG